MATTDVAVEECNELLRCLLRQICATNLSDLHICIDVGTESMTRARVLLGAVGWLFVYSHLTTLHNLSVFTVELVGHRLTAADIDTMRGAIPIAPIDGESLLNCAYSPSRVYSPTPQFLLCSPTCARFRHRVTSSCSLLQM